MADPCRWCRGTIPPDARRDAVFCGVRCRQASHRFGRALVRREAAASPRWLRFGDPPYPQLARRYYGDEPEFEGEVDHRALLGELALGDGWALSTSADALPGVLDLLERDGADPWRRFDIRGRRVRVGSWHRGDRPGASLGPRQGWEPVLYVAGREELRSDWTPDVLEHVARARTTEPRRLIGAKPGPFWAWVFELLGARPGDRFDDLFPGTGGGGRAWHAFARSSRDASDPAADDTSSSPAGDASSPAAGDASEAPRGDASRRARTDASSQYSGDGSR